MGKLSLVTNPNKQGLTNTGAKQFAKMKMIDAIKTADPFKILFPVKASLVDIIARDIESNGFDYSQPLIVWKEKDILIDGHTRLAAAREAGIQQVPVYEQSFEDEDSALEYAIHLQKDRRNLTDAELYACIRELDKRDTHGGDRKSEKIKSASKLLKSDGKNSSGASRDKTASVVGTSGVKVQKVRTIEDYGSDDIKENLAQGEISINKAYQKVQEKRKAEKQKAVEVPDTNSEVVGIEKPRLYYEGKILIMKSQHGLEEILEFKSEVTEELKDRVLALVTQAKLSE